MIYIITEYGNPTFASSDFDEAALLFQAALDREYQRDPRNKPHKIAYTPAMVIFTDRTNLIGLEATHVITKMEMSNYLSQVEWTEAEKQKLENIFEGIV